jgi:hypothetical protein
MKASRTLLTAGLLFLMLLQVSAQGTNFSGTWAFNESKSKMGDSQFRRGATLISAKQEGNILSIDRTQAGFDGNEMKTSEKLNLDGTVSESTGMMDSKRKAVAKWSADNKSLDVAITTIFNMNGDNMEMKSSESWSLGEGNTLIINSASSSPDGQEMKSTLVYDKK